jgi:hypothetical protein
MLIERIKDRVSKPDPAWKRTGYWLSGFGVVLTLLLGTGAIVSPQNPTTKFIKIPPCLILAGLALEGYEAIAANRKGGNDDES